MRPPPTVYEIPKDARIVECSDIRCRAPIAFITTPAGKRMPVEAAANIRGESHYIRCPGAKRFRRSSKP